MSEKPHKIMTPEEYAALPIRGWHRVCRDIDGAGNVGVQFDGVIVPLRPNDPDQNYLRCSQHPKCEGPSLRPDHDEVCPDGDECTDDACWRGCQYCIAEEQVN